MSIAHLVFLVLLTSPFFAAAAIEAQSTVSASDLSGQWSTLFVPTGAVSTTKLVQQGNTLLQPYAKDPRIPYSFNVTLFGNVGAGTGALFSTTDGSFCSWTEVVLEVVDAGFMRLTYFPKPQVGTCSPFAGGVLKFTRPY